MAAPIRRRGGGEGRRPAGDQPAEPRPGAGQAAGGQTLEQRRSAYAWQQVNGAPTESDFVNLLKGLPAMMMGNGLLQTLAYLVDKGKAHHKAAAKLVVGWLGKRDIIDAQADRDVRWGELEALTKLPSDEYMRATEEALAILRWARQFAAARDKSDSKGNRRA